MKININITIDLTVEQELALLKLADMCGFSGITNTRHKIKKYLVSRISDTIHYCEEKVSKDE